MVAFWIGKVYFLSKKLFSSPWFLKVRNFAQLGKYSCIDQEALSLLKRNGLFITISILNCFGQAKLSIQRKILLVNSSDVKQVIVKRASLVICFPQHLTRNCTKNKYKTAAQRHQLKQPFVHSKRCISRYAEELLSSLKLALPVFLIFFTFNLKSYNTYYLSTLLTK